MIGGVLTTMYGVGVVMWVVCVEGVSIVCMWLGDVVYGMYGCSVVGVG